MADAINGAFEVLGAIFVFLSIQRLYADKLVRGVHWAAVAYFSSWGAWNLYYYPSLDQWASFFGAIAICSANTIYLCMIFYYLWNEKHGLATILDDSNLEFDDLSGSVGTKTKGVLLDPTRPSDHTWRP